MTFDLATLGTRLKNARINCGITQDKAAEALGIPRTAIVQIENGNRAVSTLELATLAELYRRPVADFFADRDPADEDVLVTLYRLAPGIEENPAFKDEVCRHIDIYREGAALEALLGRKPRSGPPAYRLSEPNTTIEAVEQGALVAAEERNRLDLGDAPIADMPDLISSQAIWASGAELPVEMSGLFVRHSTFGMAILVNLSHVRARQRFSYAHEFGHALMDRDHSVNVTTQTNSNDLIEKRANAFAAAFLAPKAGVEWILEALYKGGPSRVEHAIYSVANNNGAEAEGRAIPGSQEITYQDVAIIAHHFGISYQAATYRLRSLDIISKQACGELLQKEALGRDYLQVLNLNEDLEGQDTAKPDRELVTQVVHAAVEAYRREEITDARILDISKRLGLQGQRLLALAKAARDS